MKKKYMEPQMEVIDMLPEGMLCVSGDIIEEANEPALVPELDVLDVDQGEELDLGL
jgi:hypothetical protein